MPDITNNQIQSNTEAAALSPVEVEKQVTFVVETSLAGIPGLEYTRSISRNGFSQVTAVFTDSTDVYFARQQVAERLGEAKESLPPGAEPRMGPISTGLGEVYMYVVEYAHPDGVGATATQDQPGWQPGGAYLTPEGELLVTPVEKEAYLRTIQDWVIKPQLRMVKGVAGVDSIGGWEKQYHVQPDIKRLVSYGFTLHDVIGALEKNNVSTGAGFIEHKGEAYVVRTDARVKTREEIGAIVVGQHEGTPVAIGDVADVVIGKELRTGAGSVVYRPVLAASIRLRIVTVATGAVAFAASIALFLTMGQEFIPTLSEGNIAMHAMRIPSTSLTQSKEMQRHVELAIRDLPEVAFVYSKTGTAEMASDPMPPSVSDTFIIMKPKSEWPNPSDSIEEVRQRVEDAVSKLPGNNYEFLQPIQMRFNELIAGVRSDLAIKLYGDDFDVLLPAANEIARVLGAIPGGEDVKVEQIEGLPVMTIDIDRGAAARFGLTMEDVQEVIAIAIGGREAGLVFEGDRRFSLVVRLPEEVRRDITAIEGLPIPIPVEDDLQVAGLDAVPPASYVPLGSIATIRIEEGLNQISRENGKRRIVIQANVRGRDLGGYVSEARSRIASDLAIPAGSWLEYGGTFENLQRARERLLIVVPVCFFVIFLLLFSTFNSVKYATLVFTGVPLGLTGGVLALWLRGIDFSISAAVGFIALSGVAVLNGLVMVSYINHLRKQGMGLEDAIRDGAMTRLRPVLMTALVAILGFVPMALSTGNGAEVQRPLATVVVGGIVSSTLLTLVVLPALYRLWHRRDETLTDEADEEHLIHADPNVT